ncbi:MAG: hypothetical protein IJR25_01185 [Bacteroidales bacterium]|nr:hypothetical protein [Bacteroidales bacterium]
MMRTRFTLYVLMLATMCVAGCKDAPVQETDLDPLVKMALYDTTSSYYTDFSTYPRNIADLPIGIFDLHAHGSGTLERTVLLDRFDNITGGEKPDRIRDFAGEHIIYYTALSDADSLYDDQGRMDIHDAAIKNTLFLVGDKCAQGDKERAKIVIAAGNITRSTGLDDIRAMLAASGSGVKAIGVVEEGVKGLLDALLELPVLNYSIGLIADSLTIASGAYQQTMQDILAERGIKSAIPLVSQSFEATDSLSTATLSTAFATMLENHYSDGKPFPICAVICDASLDDDFSDEDLAAAFQEVINNYRSKRINGNYPYRSVVSDKLIIVNPAELAAMECYRVLRKDNNLALRIEDQQVLLYTDLPM